MTRSKPRPATAFSGLAVLTLAVVSLAASGPATVPAAEAVVAPRIVGGSEVNPPDKYPFVVALVRSWYEDEYQGQYCGGSLLTPEWVLTAGHCVTNNPEDIDVLVGRHDLTDDGQGERIGAAEVHRHPGFDQSTLTNDVALIRLERAATVGSPVGLATAADAPFFAPGVVATVAGWGWTLPDDSEKSPTLQEVGVPIVSDEDCAAAYPDDFFFPQMLCAGDLLMGGVDACFGDSGGPLFVDGLQVGVVSGGFGCAEPGQPGLYARVATYEGWIASVLAGTPPPPTYYCRGRPATIVGTSGSDVLHGTDGDDVIVARGGSDEVWGDDGDDVICLGSGDDRAYGGSGDDVVLGQLGDDYLEGNRGADLLIGRVGDDSLLGGEDPDVLRGNRGDDHLWGLAGDDRLQGGPGNDTLAGGAGDDRLRGGPGCDVLRGGLGADVCFSGEDAECEAVVGDPGGC